MGTPSTHLTLVQEMTRLTAEQMQARQSAIFLGMTPDEAKDYDARRAKILELIKELQQLEAAA
jgi:hypothetical protein